MAGASSKRISASNASTLRQLQLGFLVSGGIYLIHLFLFRSGRSWKRLFLFVVTETVAVSLWSWVMALADKGADISAGTGLTTYIFDVIYVTWAVHVLTALVSAQFWKLYWIIPLYALYRLFLLLLPRFFPSLALLLPGLFPSSPAAQQPAAGGVAPAEPAYGQPRPESKRQQKLAKRVERGDRRVQYREQKGAQ
ncbi:hypothetical protein JCM8547_001802 [Rhodosporidiobolus lusitaniae]